MSTGRSCNEMGLCQHRKPACPGCTAQRPALRPVLRLAPGVLDAYRVPRLGTRVQRRELLRWVLWSAVWAGVSVLAGLALGLIAGARP